MLVNSYLKLLKIIGMSIPISFLIGLGLSYLYARGVGKTIRIVTNKYGEHDFETILIIVGIGVLCWYLWDEIHRP